MTASLRPAPEETPAVATGPIVCPMYDRKPAPARLLALDLSLRATGWARNTAGFNSGCFPELKKVNGIPRLQKIRDGILGLTESGGPDLVIIEGISFGSKGAMHAEICGLAYLVRVSLTEAGIPWTEVPPSTLKKFATGKGNADKADVLAAAIRRLNYQGSDHNEADALWLLQMGLHFYSLPGRVELPEAHRCSLAKVQWPVLRRPA